MVMGVSGSGTGNPVRCIVRFEHTTTDLASGVSGILSIRVVSLLVVGTVLSRSGSSKKNVGVCMCVCVCVFVFLK